MKTYTLLLVDDEEIVIQSILKKIHWEELGFSVIGHADNGVKALEIMEEYQPDVVMTDIKMPYMDGMELANHIKTEYPATKILFFTGFDEFEYAKEAVHLEVEEYILKPLNAAELTNVFSHLKTKLDQEISEKRNTQTLQNHYMESLPFLRTNFYSSLIEGRIAEDEVNKYLSDYQISLTGPCYCCLVIHTSSTEVPEDMTPQLLATSVQELAIERLGKKWRTKYFTYLGNTILIAQLNEETSISELTDECDRFCKYARRIIQAVVTVGIGPVCKNILDLANSYNSARKAVSYRVIYGASQALNMKEIAPQEAEHPETVNDKYISHLFKMIRLSSEDDVIYAVNQYIDHICFPAQTLTRHDLAVMELISALYRFAINNEISTDDFSKDMPELYTHLLELEPETLRKWLIDTCLIFREKIIRARYHSTKSFISGAEDYVHSHYGNEDLSLDTLCETLGVSNSYFSTIFKKETGKSFIAYLTDYRMEKAARLLIETNEKSYIIAKKVGYTDPNYFSYVFKRRFGISPTKYRTEYAKSES